jgi:hypothetical protein
MSLNAKKTALNGIKAAGATRRTMNQQIKNPGPNFNSKTKETKIPGIGFRQISDSALTGREAVRKQQVRNYRKNPSNGIGVGY